MGNRAHNKDRGEGLWEIEIDALSDGARPNLFYRQVRSSVVNRAKGQHFRWVYNLTHDGACAASPPPPVRRQRQSGRPHNKRRARVRLGERDTWAVLIN